MPDNLASMEGETTNAGVPTQRRASSMPACLLVRYWFGNPEGTVRGYFGAGPGVYISFLDTTKPSEARQTTFGSSGFAVAVPIGFVYSVNERIFLNFSYSFNWLADNDYLDNGIVNTFGLGLGFILSN
jgi:outer membrane protein W